MSLYEVDISVTARQATHRFGERSSPFADRSAEFTVHVSVPDIGPETSAHAIRDGLIEAAAKAAQVVQG